LKETTCWVERTIQMVNYRLISLALTRVLYLNNQNQLIAGETLFTGTINRTEVHPREVIKRALYHNAAAVVLAHNHPSGEVTPSKADRLITERLVQALALVDIRVPDHLIIGGSQVFSFAEHGLL
ncbi:DNA repair protein RadC, partial [Escherichia coli]|uniref:RadC family protein n=1 Tax=Escherichia coli TaxID=562 RepID=UPI003748FA85